MLNSKEIYDKKLQYLRRAKIKNTSYVELLKQYKLYKNSPSVSYCLKYITLNDNGNIRPHSCKSRICSHCRQKKRQKFYSIFEKNLDTYLEDDKSFLSLTLTIKNCDVSKLKEIVAEMRANLKRLLEKKKFKCLQNPDIKPNKKDDCSSFRFAERVHGYLTSLEITYSPKDSSAHPHFHVILDCDASLLSENYISKNVLSLMWKEVLGVDYDPEVNVQGIKTTARMTQKEKLKKVFSYVNIDSIAFENNLKTYGESFAKWLENFNKQTKGMRYLTAAKSMNPLLKAWKNYNDSDGKNHLLVWDKEKEAHLPYSEKDNTPPLVADSLSIPLNESFPKPLAQSCRQSNPQVSYSPSLPHERPYSESGYLVGRSIDSSTP